MEEWEQIDEFPEYSVSDQGRVKNEVRGNILKPTTNQQGIIKYGLMRDGRQHHRSAAILVAKAFLPQPKNPNFNSPIHLNGDRQDLRAENLMWRPRWFAAEYHRQFSDPKRKGFVVPIEEIETGEQFKDGFEAAEKYGLLSHEIVIAVFNNTSVFPTYQRFRVIE